MYARRVDRTFIRLGLAVFAAIITACSDGAPVETGSDLLRGLAATTRNDSSPQPDSVTTPTPGYFRGYLYGYEAGADSMSAAVPLSGARVTAYERAEAAGAVVPGRQVAEVISNAEGFFQLPTLAGGDYVVTFVPATASPYRGGWTIGHASEQSGEYPWTIMLMRR
jgi:hypothetical protein